MIRAFLSCFVFFLFTHSAMAQPTKGTRFVGASVDLSFRNHERADRNMASSVTIFSQNNETNGYQLGLYPYMGYFVKDGLAIGAELSLNFRSDKSENTMNIGNSTSFSSGHSQGVGASVFLKQMNNLKGNLGWYLRPELGYSFSWHESQTNKKEPDGTGINVGESSIEGRDQRVFINTTAGLYYFISDRWSLEADLLSITLAYDHSKVEKLVDNTHADGSRNEVASTHENSGYRIYSNLTNQFSLSQTFTVNYYF